MLFFLFFEKDNIELLENYSVSYFTISVIEFCFYLWSYLWGPFPSFFILEVSTYKKNRLREGVVLLRQSSGWSLSVTRIKLPRVGR